MHRALPHVAVCFFENLCNSSFTPLPAAEDEAYFMIERMEQRPRLKLMFHLNDPERVKIKSQGKWAALRGTRNSSLFWSFDGRHLYSVLPSEWIPYLLRKSPLRAPVWKCFVPS